MTAITEECRRSNAIDGSTTAAEGLGRMSTDGSSYLGVVRGETLEGVVSLEDLVRDLARRDEGR